MYDTTSYTNQLLDDLDGRMESLTSIKDVMTDPIDSLKTDLTDLNSKPVTDSTILSTAMSDLTIQSINIIPGTPDVSDLESMMNNCDLLEDSFLNKPQNTLYTELLNSNVSLVENVLEDAKSSIFAGIPEYSPSKTTNEINKRLITFNTPTILSETNGLVNCLDNFGIDVSSYISDISGILSLLGITNLGALDLTTIFGDIGLGIDTQLNLDNCLGSLIDIDSSVISLTMISATEMFDNINILKGVSGLLGSSKISSYF